MYLQSRAHLTLDVFVRDAVDEVTSRCNCVETPPGFWEFPSSKSSLTKVTTLSSALVVTTTIDQILTLRFENIVRSSFEYNRGLVSYDPVLYLYIFLLDFLSSDPCQSIPPAEMTWGFKCETKQACLVLLLKSTFLLTLYDCL